MTGLTTLPQPPARLLARLPGARLVSMTVPQVRRIDADELESRTLEAYRALRVRLDAEKPNHVVRMWNFIPDLLAETAPGRDRYMSFNAGRYAGMTEWFGDASRLEASAPSASGVGTPGDDLVIHALALDEPAVPVQNPRQTPAVQYSERYGVRPPCFARGTRIGRTLLVSGTAAITGEASVVGSLDRQLEVTLENLRVLLQTAYPSGAPGLEAFTSLRVYFPYAGDRDAILAGCRAAFVEAGEIELVNVDLCRRELRVEIEGVVESSA